LAEYIVALLVNFQVAFGEFGGFDPQFFRDTVDVAVVKNRADRFAAIGAAQAVDLAECLLVQGMNTFIQVDFFVVFPEFLEKSLCLLFNPTSTLSELFDVVFIHWA